MQRPAHTEHRHFRFMALCTYPVLLLRTQSPRLPNAHKQTQPPSRPCQLAHASSSRPRTTNNPEVAQQPKFSRFHHIKRDVLASFLSMYRCKREEKAHEGSRRRERATTSSPIPPPSMRQVQTQAQACHPLLRNNKKLCKAVAVKIRGRASHSLLSGRIGFGRCPAVSTPLTSEPLSPPMLTLPFLGLLVNNACSCKYSTLDASSNSLVAAASCGPCPPPGMPAETYAGLFRVSCSVKLAGSGLFRNQWPISRLCVVVVSSITVLSRHRQHQTWSKRTSERPAQSLCEFTWALSASRRLLAADVPNRHSCHPFTPQPSQERGVSHRTQHRNTFAHQQHCLGPLWQPTLARLQPSGTRRRLTRALVLTCRAAPRHLRSFSRPSTHTHTRSLPVARTATSKPSLPLSQPRESSH